MERNYWEITKDKTVRTAIGMPTPQIFGDIHKIHTDITKVAEIDEIKIDKVVAVRKDQGEEPQNRHNATC